MDDRTTVRPTNRSDDPGLWTLIRRAVSNRLAAVGDREAAYECHNCGIRQRRSGPGQCHHCGRHLRRVSRSVG